MDGSNRRGYEKSWQEMYWEEQEKEKQEKEKRQKKVTGSIIKVILVILVEVAILWGLLLTFVNRSHTDINRAEYDEQKAYTYMLYTSGLLISDGGHEFFLIYDKFSVPSVISVPESDKEEYEGYDFDSIISSDDKELKEIRLEGRAKEYNEKQKIKIKIFLESLNYKEADEISDDELENIIGKYYLLVE